MPPALLAVLGKSGLIQTECCGGLQTQGLRLAKDGYGYPFVCQGRVLLAQAMGFVSKNPSNGRGEAVGLSKLEKCCRPEPRSRIQ